MIIDHRDDASDFECDDGLARVLPLFDERSCSVCVRDERLFSYWLYIKLNDGSRPD
jgi:hypothetical protein